MSDNRDFKYEIINELGIISEASKGWKKELTRISWNGGEPKYDIRDWNENHDKMGKGVTLTEMELRKLKELVDAEISFLDNSDT
ncbi:YdbC family protein [Acetoanaerobium noterae]|uniref:YdbC family protein n=1 Tax=Acetoanaerobium noterae TaxID=745369 RepID=UPI0028A9286D|nr:PC4/YdbC family ssDNA-binding protein [Acetoanaerobium noterae]